MQCPRCQASNPESAQFCGDCGETLTACRQCGASLASGQRFCRSCGTSATGAAPAGTSPAPSLVPSPRAYTPAHLADKILKSRDALEGERKLVTVLFCDIANSTSLAERLGPEAMHELLNRFFGMALAEVH